MEKDINFNYSNCVKEYDNWGETTYVNVCTNQKDIVPWGVTGYMVFGFLVLMGILFITILIGFIKMIFE